MGTNYLVPILSGGLPPVLQNFSPNGVSMPNFHTALQTRQPRVLVYSDSTGEGHAAGTVKEWMGAWPNLAPNYMTNSRTARSMSWASWGHGSTFNATDDNRWTLGSGWGTGSQTTFCSGLTLQNSANTSTFVPMIVDQNGNASNATFDSVKVWYGQHNATNYGAASISDNGGSALATPNSHAVNDSVVSTATLAISTNVAIAATGGGSANFRVCGVECWHSTETNAIRIVNAATSGTTAANYGSAAATLNSTPQASIQALIGFSPDLLVISLGLNDQTNPGEPVGPISLGGVNTGSYINAIDQLASAGKGGISSVASITNGGTGYTTGTYTSIPLTYSGAQGGGSGGVAGFGVTAGGAVNNVNISFPGKGYSSGDSLTAAVPGGSGLTFTVNVLKYDVLLVMQNPIDPNANPVANQQAYLNTLMSYAAANGFPLLNMYSYYGGSFAAAINKGYMTLGDSKHSTLLGYQQYAQQFANILSVA